MKMSKLFRIGPKFYLSPSSERIIANSLLPIQILLAMCAALVKRKADEVLANRKNSNNITEIFNQMQNDSKHQVICMQELQRIFTTFFERRDFDIDPNLKLVNEKEWKIESQYIKWLNEIHEKILEFLYKLLDEETENVDFALATLMGLLSAEAVYQSHNPEKNEVVRLNFPEHRLEKIVNLLISTKFRRKNLILSFETYLKLKDVYFYTWKILRKVLPNITESGDIFVVNMLELLGKIPVIKPSDKNDESTMSETLCEVKGGKDFVCDASQVQKFATKVWKNLINRKVSLAVHRKLMLTLLESFLPHLENPVYFTDFFMASSNLGGANALLALQGILILVQKHNIEYPNIYGKLYSMFEPNIFHTRYKSRLFHLADIFLSSTHLPENMVASFAKRVSRLCLNAQISDAIIGIRFVQNLILRHPGLKKMIQHPEQGEVGEDPFLADEPDPMKTKAVDSCLWEIWHLKNHIQPSVSSIAHFIDKSLPNMEYDLREVLDTTNEEMFEKEAKKRLKVSVSMDKPQKIAKLQDDKIYKMWLLT